MIGEGIRADRKQLWTRKALALLASAAVLSGCNGKTDAGDPVPQQPPSSSTIAPNASRAITPAAVFTFDNIGSTYPGAETIFVYPGPLDTPEDKRYNARYNNGDKMPALCIAIGRRLIPDPSYHESPRPTEVQDKWIKIVDTGSVDEYASLTYGRLDPPDAQLPQCTDVT